MKRLMTLCSLFALTTLSLITPLTTHAQISAAPSLMNFQGRLTRPDGTPVADGTYAIRFSLWDALSGGTEKWNQTVASVAVKNGTFAVLLNTNAANLFAGDLYLEIKIGADVPLTPRQQLVSVAYALKANSVPDGSITGASIANGAITSDKLASNALGWLLSGNNITNPSTQFLGTTSNQPLVFRTNNNEQARLLTNGRLGLGTTTPGVRLEIVTAGVADGLRLTGSGVNSPQLGFFENNSERGSLALALGGGQYSASAVSGDIVLRTGPGKLLLQNGPGVAALAIANNRVGIGTLTPANPLSVSGNADISGNVVISDNLDVFGVLRAPRAGIESSATSGTRLDILNSSTGGRLWSLLSTGSANGEGAGNLVFRASGGASAILKSTGEFVTKIVTVTGGSDVAEPYNVAPAGDIKPLPGMVVCIDGDKVGQMKVAGKAYDKTVAGILSGANGIRPGLTLTQKGTIADGELPVASLGRVWCWCDADQNGAIEAGDMLTTSDTPGHAMKVKDHTKANGSVIGKAMSSLKSGKGLVLVLVSLK